MKRSFLFAFPIVALTAMAAATTLAQAADMVVKARPPVLPNWTGFYFGASAGAGVGRKRFYDLYGPVPDFALDADSQVRGWLGGFQLGYNQQFGWLVLGLQGDFDWAGIKRTFSCFSFGDQTCSADAEWIATLTGRIGAVVGPALLYLDGGPAWTRDTISNIAGTAACVPTGGTTVCSSPGDLFLGSQIRAGWTVGAGVEYRLSPNWSVNVQYNFMNFGSFPITLVDGGTGIFDEEVKQQIHVVKFGVNYKLTGPGVGVAPLAYGPEAVAIASDEDDTGKTTRAFSTLDVGKDSVDGLIGGLFAFSKDLDTSGPRVWMVGGAGWYQYPDGANKIKGVYSTGDLLGGYGFEGNNYEINLLVGGSAENDMLSGYDVTNPVQGTAVGAKARGDLWMNPTPKSVVVAEAEYSTAFQTYYTSAKYGYDILNKGYFIGPEAAAFGNARYNQWRAGAHVTALKFGRVGVDLSAGFAHDSVVGNGAYSHVEVSTSF